MLELYNIVNYDDSYLTKLQELFIDFISERDGRKLLNKEEIFNNLEEYLSEEWRVVYLAISNETNELVWFFIWEIRNTKWFYLEKIKFWYISYLFVSSKCRWAGISSKFKDKYINYLNDNNITKIKLSCFDSNDKAKAIYSKWWFKISKLDLTMDI